MVKPEGLESSERDAEFDRAFAKLNLLVDLQQADRLHPVRSNAVYANSVVLWMLVCQRMNPDVSLEAAVKKQIRSRPDFLPDKQTCYRRNTLDQQQLVFSGSQASAN